MQRPDPAASFPSVHIVHGRPSTLDLSEERAQVLATLRRELPTVESKYFYDDRGSHLFEDITRLPEYYQTRTEESLLEAVAEDIVRAADPRELVELGSGAGRKVRLLLDAIRRHRGLRACVLLDINESFLRASSSRLAAAYPEASMRGVVGDFLHDLDAVGPGRDRLFIFLAGTIGNLHPDELPGFLTLLRGALGEDDTFLVGLDLVKDPAILEAAYNDAAGVTARFNRNILRVLSRRFDLDFDVDAFEHVAFYDAERRWIEMRLRALRPLVVATPDDGPPLEFATGDEIRTEISCKVTRASFVATLEGTGLELARWYTDPDELFALALVRPA